MAICKFFQAGTCRKGNSCTFEHIKPNAAAANKYNETSIKTNLTEERPQWKLSVYGPAKEEPNLIVGTDKSCEEDRLLYYMSMRTTGNESQYIASHEQSFNQMETQVNAILNNPTGAIQHYEKEKSNHSGPFGGSVNNAPFAPFTGGGAFGGNSGGVFGQPSAFGAAAKPTSAFGQPSAFGAAAKPVSAFGQPSAFGQTSSFGSTNTLGGGSAFGSTSVLGGGSAFGATSSLGSGGATAFGSTSALGSGSAFGSTSTLGSGSAFGSTSALGSGSAFGSTSALGSGSAFGSTSALGGGSAFGQPSAFGAMANKPAAAAPTSAFGNNSTTSAFGSTSTLGGGAFGSTAPTTSAFGSASNTTSTPFGTPSTGLGGNTNAFGTSTTNTMQSEVKDDSPEWQAFAASEFTYRMIPEIEPPIQLR